ncbi:hypothetical protein H0H93_009630 [Arthromyces matolae]|nr:hypothetical protein H0H93_009630 [Arthromyces matolae]
MLMRMKGHNGKSPCRMCEIKAVRVPESRATTHYVPLDQTSFAEVQGSSSRPHVYNPRNLPLRTHQRFLEQAAEVDHSVTNVAAEALAKESGIKGTPLLSVLSSLSLPHSFPHDFMHLMWENTLDNLLDHWTGAFKGLDDGIEAYQFEKTVWDAIGEATATSGSTIPSAYGARVLNVAKDRTYFSAEMISLWTMYIAPVVLRRHFTSPRYYKHFIQLVQIIITCLQFEITDDEIEGIREDMIEWVQDYKSIYYQHDPTRVSTCPVTIHALLHIADSIKFAGPVWCYWAFPMERYCGQLQPAIKSRRFPYASLDRRVTETAQLSQIKVIYDVSAALSLSPPRGQIPGSFSIPECV